MDSEAVLETMVAAGIVETDGDRVFPTAEFESERERIREEGAREPDWLPAGTVDGETLDDDFLGTAAAVAAFAEGMDPDEMALIATVLDRLEDPPMDAGVPAGFTPLHQEDIRGFLDRHEASVLFVWKPGDPSCEAMADTLSRLHDRPAVEDVVGLGSICVEDGAELLRERYDVALLPTTLFFVDDAVDSRVIGPRDLPDVTREVEIITEAAGTSGTTSRQNAG